jgi:hypothetical protein
MIKTLILLVAACAADALIRPLLHRSHVARYAASSSGSSKNNETSTATTVPLSSPPSTFLDCVKQAGQSVERDSI